VSVSVVFRFGPAKRSAALLLRPAEAVRTTKFPHPALDSKQSLGPSLAFPGEGYNSPIEARKKTNLSPLLSGVWVTTRVVAAVYDRRSRFFNHFRRS